MKADFFPIQFLENLPSDELDALDAICNEFLKFEKVAQARAEYHDDYLEIYSILKAFAGHRKINSIAFPDATSSNQMNNITVVRNCIHAVRADVSNRILVRGAQGHHAAKTKHYSAIFSGITMYEFSDNDFKRIQTLINELRELIVKNDALSEGHKARLLKRLEAMQGELHKKTSDIDRFWGFIGEVGINIRKFGENMAPISERVQELGKIVIAVIYAKEGVPLPPEVSKFLLPDTKKRDEQN
jgi:hypothetical protein